MEISLPRRSCPAMPSSSAVFGVIPLWSLFCVCVCRPVGTMYVLFVVLLVGLGCGMFSTGDGPI